jgi:hypothetical protein
LNKFPNELLRQKKLIVKTRIHKNASKIDDALNNEFWKLGEKFEVILENRNSIKIANKLATTSIVVYEINCSSLYDDLIANPIKFETISDNDYAKENLNKNQSVSRYNLIASLKKADLLDFIEIELELKKNEEWTKVEKLLKKNYILRTITLEKAEEIVQSYSLLLANSSAEKMARPISSLPYSKEEIIHSIKLYIQIIPEGTKGTLYSIYPFLNYYVEDELAEKINNIDLKNATDEERELVMNFSKEITEGILNNPIKY